MFKNLDELKKKKLYTIVAVILLTAMYVIIFLFSSESGEESSDLSAGIADFLYGIYYRLIGFEGTGDPVLVQQASPLEAIIRKVAHFTEYFIIGFLSYGIVVMWYRSKWKGRGLVLLQVFISGALDEFHQYFIPGRAAMFRDVLIDTAGGAAGILLLVIWLDGKKKIRDN